MANEIINYGPPIDGPKMGPPNPTKPMGPPVINNGPPDFTISGPPA